MAIGLPGSRGSGREIRSKSSRSRPRWPTSPTDSATTADRPCYHTSPCRRREPRPDSTRAAASPWQFQSRDAGKGSDRVHGTGRGAGPGRAGRRGGCRAGASTLAWPGLDRARWRLGESVAVNGCCLTVVGRRRASGSTSRRGPRPCSARTSATRRAGDRGQPRAVAAGRRPPRRALRPGARRHHGRPPRAPARGRVGVPRLRDRPGLDPADGPQGLDRRRRREPDPGRRRGPTGSRSCSSRTPWPSPPWASLQPGDRVNIETDMLAKHVAKLLGIGG